MVVLYRVLHYSHLSLDYSTRERENKCQQNRAIAYPVPLETKKCRPITKGRVGEMQKQFKLVSSSRLVVMILVENVTIAVW